jgi:hypothetical protein
MLTIKKTTENDTFYLYAKKAVLCEKLSFSVGFFHNLHLDTGGVIFSSLFIRYVGTLFMFYTKL